jgi:metal-responsive CopG/Arc/MetJ family transcriptional regulator
MTNKPKVKERFTVGFPPDQLNRIDELSRMRNRRGERTSRAQLVREAVALYLQHQPDLVGSRKAIARDLEAKIDALDGKIETLAQRLEFFIEMLRNRRSGG